MTDDTANIILEHLRALRADLSVIKDDIREIKSRLTSLEAAVAGMRRDSANLFGDVVESHVRHDRLVERIERIERRLDLRDAEQP